MTPQYKTILVPFASNDLLERGLTAPPLSQNPAAVYLARLTSDFSRRTMRAALDKIAALDGQDALTFAWAQLRYQHTAMLRARLAADLCSRLPPTSSWQRCAGC